MAVELWSPRTFMGPFTYNVTSSTDSGAHWTRVFRFQIDDPIEISDGHIGFPKDGVGFVAVGWTYAVTTDRGRSWSVWDSYMNPDVWNCYPYGTIGEIVLHDDGTGTMNCHVVEAREDVPALRTDDYGQTWEPDV